MLPWGTSFVDSSAQWIWNNPVAEFTTVEFVKTFYVASSHPSITGSTLIATIYMCADNYASAYLNGKFILESVGWGDACATSNFVISTVHNTLRILGTNYYGPAGLLVSVYLQNDLLLHSDGSWCSDSSCASDGILFFRIPKK